jgi:hypothetical protein
MDARKEVFAVDRCCYLFDAPSRRIGVTAIHHRTRVSPCCAGKPKKSSAGPNWRLKHAHTSEYGEVEATMQQTIQNWTWQVDAQANLSPPWVGQDRRREAIGSGPAGLGALRVLLCIGFWSVFRANVDTKTLVPFASTATQYAWY